MTLSVAFQMDPFEKIHVAGDSTYALALEAKRRGHQMFHYPPEALALEEATLRAAARSFDLGDERDSPFLPGDAVDLEIGEMDVVLMRQDPPFDLAYITATHLLEHVMEKTLVVNDPIAVRNAPEKLLVMQFPELMPPTLITRDPERIADFRSRHKDIIVKPLYGNGGAGVFHIGEQDDNLNALLEIFSQINREPLMIQRYLPEVRAGDKRIILIDGEAAGAINRVPAEGEARSNMHVGGRPEQIGLSARDHEICEAIGPLLKEQGLIFVGIDVIGDYLTEINVTSPTGLREIERFTGVNLAASIWDAIEEKL